MSGPGQGRGRGLSKRLAIEGRRIATQHQRLGELWQQFIGAIESAELELMRLSFRELRDGMLAHFEVEERVQIPALHGADSGLHPVLARIVDDHTRFRSELDALMRDVEAGAFEALLGPVEKLHDSLAEHEALEENLFPGAKREK
jgi:iron-sulfur cluster repair protein YtfE (RIC family)